MDLNFILSIILVVLGAMTVFSRQPFFSLFSLLGLIFTMMIIFLVRGNAVLSSVLLLSIGPVVLVIVVQLFMNLDLEKEFQQYYKMNVVPMFGMTIMGIIFGVLVLAVYSSKDSFLDKINNQIAIKKLQVIFTTYDQVILLAVLGLLGVITTASLLVDFPELTKRKDDD